MHAALELGQHRSLIGLAPWNDEIRITITILNEYMYKATTYSLHYLHTALSTAIAMGGKAKKHALPLRYVITPPKFNVFYPYIICRVLLVSLHRKANWRRIFALVSATPALTSPPCPRAKWCQRQE